MRSLRLSTSALLIAVAIGHAAAQPAEKPAIEIKTRAAEISVTIEKALKPFPGLAADLLAEGQRYVAKSRAEADEEYKTNKAWFKEHRWTNERSYSFRSLVADRYVSIVRDDSTYTGGAHPNSRADTILWDKAAKKRISIRPFFTETADGGPTMKAMVKAVLTSLTAEKKKRDAGETATDGWFEYVQPKLLKIGAVTLASSTVAGKSSGLTFHYPPTAVGPYAEGEYVAFVPWETLKPYLTSEGIKVFGGARPKGDDDGQQ